MRMIRIVLALLAAVTLASAAELATKKALTLQVATGIAAAAEEHGKASNWKVVIAIVDDGANLVLSAARRRRADRQHRDCHPQGADCRELQTTVQSVRGSARKGRHRAGRAAGRVAEDPGQIAGFQNAGSGVSVKIIPDGVAPSATAFRAAGPPGVAAFTVAVKALNEARSAHTCRRRRTASASPRDAGTLG